MSIGYLVLLVRSDTQVVNKTGKEDIICKSLKSHVISKGISLQPVHTDGLPSIHDVKVLHSWVCLLS